MHLHPYKNNVHYHIFNSFAHHTFRVSSMIEPKPVLKDANELGPPIEPAMVDTSSAVLFAP